MHSTRRRAGFALLVITTFAVAAVTAAARADDPAQHRAALLAGVSEIGSPGAPGALALVNEDAFPLVLGASGKDLHEPVVAASLVGRGRVVALAHGGYLGATDAGSVRLLQNAVTWVGRGRTGRPLTVAAHRIDGAVIDRLARGQAWAARASVDVDALAEVDVIVMRAGRASDQEVQSLHRWVRRGGGLIVAATGWGWQQLNRDRALATDGPMNRLGLELGIVWTNGTVGDTAADAFVTDRPLEDELFNAATLLEVLVREPARLAALEAGQRRQVERTVLQAVRAVDVERGPLRSQLRAFRNARRDPIVPTEQQPIKADDTAARLSLLLDWENARRGEPRSVRPHPAAAAFPGAPPRGSRPTRASVTIDRNVPRWHSTGLYAAPGALLTVESDDDGAIAGLAVRIGCHKDTLYGKDRWRRAPEITLERPLLGPRTSIANPFGGLVYIVVPSGQTRDATVSVTISGAVRAPLYVHGETGVDEWQRTIRDHPGPWGELASDRVIVSVPASVLRDLDDPSAVMDVWDRVMDADADLAGIPRERPSPMRMVADVQISAGYMHSGYPIMTHLDVRENFVSVEKLVGGQWGFYHELGHNHQSGMWTFSGTGEVTCNLFALYVYQQVGGLGLDSDRLHEGIVPASRARHIEKHYGPGKADWEAWKSKPFVALTMYVQLLEAFGWEALRDVIAGYHDLPEAERPRREQDKRDTWMVRYSRQVERDLSGFFLDWGVPVSDEARSRVSHLDAWAPE
jgi:hypothetical protein